MEKSKIVKSWELKATSQKSFYKKAYVLEDKKGNLFLQSYDTIVCGIINGIFKKFWDGYSRTTQTHINDFRNAHNMETLYIEYTNKLKTLYNEVLDKCGDNRQLKSSMKEALEGVRVY